MLLPIMAILLPAILPLELMIAMFLPMTGDALADDSGDFFQKPGCHC
ncbi:MAG: hypothetical protein FWD31_09885 [Planctomycetaceae bacterium]|nr:hypothetical protein [Planctomycetaceae bacterium]